MQSERWQHLAGYAAALIAGTAAGLVYAVNKELTRTLSPLQVTWLEALIAFVIMFPPYFVRHRRNLVPRDAPWKWLLTFGLIAVMLFYCRTLGVALTSPTTASLVVRFEVVLVILYSYLFLTERLSPLGWLGAGLLVAGVLAALDLSAEKIVLQAGGIAALLGCAVGIASNAVVIKLHLGRVRTELIFLANVGTQSVAFLVFLLAASQLGSLPRLLAQPHTLALVLVGGLLIAGMLTPYYYAMKRIPMWACRLLGLVTPLVAILADVFWLHSAIGMSQLLGLALVTGGAALVVLSGVGKQLVTPEA